MALVSLLSWRWMLANLVVALYLIHAYHRVHGRAQAVERAVARARQLHQQAMVAPSEPAAALDAGDAPAAGEGGDPAGAPPPQQPPAAVASPLPGSAATDYACTAAGGAPRVDAAAATGILKDACPSRYQNTTLCDDLGPSCVLGDDLVLYHPARQPQPSDGWYRRLAPDVFKRLDQVMFWVSWGGANADGYSGNLMRFENHRGFVKAWPAGAGAAPPVPFSTCTTPLVLYWDFPENYYHTMAAFATLWGAVRRGAIPRSVTVAVGLPHPYLNHGGSGKAAPAPVGGAEAEAEGDAAAGAPVGGRAELPEYITAPLGALFDGPVVPLWRLAEHGQEDAPSGVTTAGAHPGGAGAEAAPGGPPPPLVDATQPGAFAGPPPAPALSAARRAQLAAQRGYGGRLGLPAVRCFASTPVCSMASYSKAPPLHFYEFMQALKDHLLGRPVNYNADSPAVAPYAWPAGKRFVTGPDGVLRVTVAVRSVGTRRVLNAAELLAECAAAGTLPVAPAGGGAAEPVRMACSAWEFGSEGMSGDAARMQETDVLVTAHGAGLTNLGFLRPGSLVVELRPGSFQQSNADRFYRPMAQASGCLKFWGVRLQGGFLRDGALEAAKQGNPEKWERDKDMLVPWEGLASVLSKLAGLSWEQWQEAAAPSGRGPFTDITS